jgi:hypothetical protein
MSSPCFLGDENVPAELFAALRQQPGLDLLVVGEPGAPPLGTQDPDLLLAAEALGRLLLSMDRRTMPQHLADHFAAGHHTAGVALIRGGFTLAQVAQDILMIWSASTAAEWVDRTDYIPY